MDLGEWLRSDWDEVGNLLGQIRPGEAEALGEMILEAQRVFVVGQGRSGLVMKMFAMRLMQVGLAAFVVGDATTPAIAAGDLLIVGSGSGETPGAVSAARRAREVGARVEALTSRSASTLGGLADHLVIIPGSATKLDVQHKSQLPLGSVLEQTMLVLVDCLCAWLAQRTGQDYEAMKSRHANLE